MDLLYKGFFYIAVLVVKKVSYVLTLHAGQFRWFFVTCRLKKELHIEIPSMCQTVESWSGWTFGGPDLGPNSLQSLTTDDKSCH